MARIDKNQRIVPEAVQDYKIQPVATPVNKLEQFSPNQALAEGNRDKNLYDSLAVFGKGVLDTKLMLDRHADDNTRVARAKAKENMDNWAEVSKNFEGMAKFNPYNKDAFKRLVAADTAREYINNLFTDPELASRTPEEVANMVENNQQDMIEAFKQKGLSAKDYSQYLIDYSNRGYALKQKHIAEHAEVEFKFIKNKFSESMGDDIATAIYNGNSISDAALNAEKTMDELGWTNQTKAEVVMNGLKSYVAKNPEASSADIEAFMSAYEIGGNKLTDYLPNGSVEMRNFVKQIKRANFEDEKLDFDIRKFHREEAMENANISFFDFISKNPNASEDEIMSMAMQCIQESGVEGREGMTFLSNIASTKGYLQSIKTVVSNENLLQQYSAQAVLGDLDYEELSQAMAGGVINWKDGQALMARDKQSKDNANSTLQKEIKLFENAIKKGQPTYQTLGAEKAKELTQTVTQIQDRVLRGEMTPEEGQRALRIIKDKIVPQIQYENQVKAKNKDLLVSYKHRINQNIPVYDRDKALKAIINMGIVRNSQGVRRQNLSVADGMTNDRNGNGIPNEKGDKHLGTDIGGVRLGDRVYPPADGTVVKLGYEQTMGYYAVIETKKGFFMVQHLQRQFNKKQGEKISRNEFIGYVGNSGRVSDSGKANGCLHAEWWNKDLSVITPYTFN